MLLWFVATAVLSVHFVFTDPRFDHRLLIVGVLLPDVVDGIVGVLGGEVMVLHSVTGAVGLLLVVMVATTGRRPVRKRLLGLPIGVMVHLVFDAAFADTAMFWWPFTGGLDDPVLPVVARGWWNLALELAGLAMGWWAWQRFGLDEPDRRRTFRETGRLGDAVGTSRSA